MTEAARWLEILAPMAPGAPLHLVSATRWILNDAASWHGTSGATGYMFRFPDNSKLLCHPIGAPLVLTQGSGERCPWDQWGITQ